MPLPKGPAVSEDVWVPRARWQRWLDWGAVASSVSWLISLGLAADWEAVFSWFVGFGTVFVVAGLLVDHRFRRRAG